MRFIDLPDGSKKALVHYFGFECCDENFSQFFNVDSLSDQDWSNVLNVADSVWGNCTYTLATLSLDQAIRFVMHNSPDLATEFSSFEEYHEDYIKSDTPAHADNSWPVLALPSCGEALLDGWHRLHSYVRSGFSEIHFIMLDTDCCVSTLTA